MIYLRILDKIIENKLIMYFRYLHWNDSNNRKLSTELIIVLMSWLKNATNIFSNTTRASKHSKRLFRIGDKKATDFPSQDRICPWDFSWKKIWLGRSLQGVPKNFRLQEGNSSCEQTFFGDTWYNSVDRLLSGLYSLPWR